MEQNEISIVVPCYKEAEVIETTLLSLHSFLKERFSRFEIITIVDGSTDNTLENIEKTGKAHPEIPLKVIVFKKNQGKGAAVKEGVLASRFDPILFIDADLTIPIEELDKFLPALKTADIAIGSRFVSGSIFEEKVSWYRVVLGRGFHILQILLLGNFEYSDTQCGFKLLKRKTALTLFERISIKRFAFDAELLFLAKKMNMNVMVLPITIKKDTRNTNVQVIRDPLNMLLALIKIRLNYWFGHYHLHN